MGVTQRRATFVPARRAVAKPKPPLCTLVEQGRRAGNSWWAIRPALCESASCAQPSHLWLLCCCASHPCSAPWRGAAFVRQIRRDSLCHTPPATNHHGQHSTSKHKHTVDSVSRRNAGGRLDGEGHDPDSLTRPESKRTTGGRAVAFPGRRWAQSANLWSVSSFLCGIRHSNTELTAGHRGLHGGSAGSTCTQQPSYFIPGGLGVSRCCLDLTSRALSVAAGRNAPQSAPPTIADVRRLAGVILSILADDASTCGAMALFLLIRF